MKAHKPTTPKPKTTDKRRRSADDVAEVHPRIARRERRRERSRDEIVDAARRVLLRNGIAGTTLDAVAKEVGLTKAALYYYYPSKDSLLFEIIYQNLVRQTHAIRDAVAEAGDGGEALAAIVRETVRTFAPRLDDFRLTFLLAQVAKPGSVTASSDEFARIRPLNEVAYGGTAKMLADDWKKAPGRAGVEPRLMAFLAGVAAVGLLTMKGMVESVGDPLAYSDEQLTEGLAKIFAAAAKP